MKKILKEIVVKNFSVYINGEFERRTDFIGLIKLLISYSDFFEYTSKEKYKYLHQLKTEKCVEIDSNIFVTTK